MRKKLFLLCRKNVISTDRCPVESEAKASREIYFYRFLHSVPTSRDFGRNDKGSALQNKSIYSLSLVLLLSISTYRANASDPFLQKSDADGIVSMEAEHFHDNVSQGSHTWTLVNSPLGASDSNAMQALPNYYNVTINDNYINESPRLDFQVNFAKTGMHYVWVRGHANESGADDSCHSGLDNQAIASSDRLSFEATANWGWFNNTLDSTPALFNVPRTGVHTVNIWMRENGAIVDKIVLTTNPAYTLSSGEGPAESARANPNPLSVDDFENYSASNEIFETWIDGNSNPGNGTGSIIPNVEQTTFYSGHQSMPYSYNNTKSPYYSEAEANTTKLKIDPNWTREGIKALTLHFFGDPDNATERMYVVLKDDANKMAVVYYDGDSNDIRDPNWYEWNIDLKKFTDVNLTAVKKVYIGFGDRNAPQQGGSGLVFFDDIRLYPTRCVPSYVKGDLNNDCVVNYTDLEIMRTYWLNDYQFEDFASLAENWLEEILWP